MKSRSLKRIGLMTFSLAALSAAAGVGIVPVGNGPALFQVPPAGKPEILAGRMDIPAGSAIAFDRHNRPFIVNAVDPECYGYISTWEDGKWVKLDFTAALKAAGCEYLPPAVRQLQTRAVISFDQDDSLYVLVPGTRKVQDKVDINGNMLLLFSSDYGKTFQVFPLHTRPYLTSMESSSSGRVPATPPVIFCAYQLKDFKGSGVTYPSVGVQEMRFCTLNRLDVIIPEKVNGRLKLPAPVTVTERAVGITSHSGSNHISARFGDRLFFCYVEVPENPETGGNPTYVAELDLKSGKVLNRKFTATATPNVSDNHATPTMAIDSLGHLQLLTGSHGWHPSHPGFLFLHGLQPGSLAEWTKPERLGAGQTYVDMVVDSKDNLHVAYRVHPQLWYQRYDHAAGRWDKPVRMVEYPPASKNNSYTVYYHHLFIDRNDNLYLKFLFNDFETGAKGKFPLMWLVSPDGGRTWQPGSGELVKKNVR